MDPSAASGHAGEATTRIGLLPASLAFFAAHIVLIGVAVALAAY